MAILVVLSISLYISFEARAGQPIGVFNTYILYILVLIDSFATLLIVYGFSYPPSIPNKTIMLQSFLGAATLWIATALSEFPMYVEWWFEGVLQEKLSYMVLGGKGLMDVLFYYGFVTALCTTMSQILLCVMIRTKQKKSGARI